MRSQKHPLGCLWQSPPVLCILMSVWLLSASLAAWAFDPPIVPNPAKTPGDVLTADVDVICSKGYTKTVRDVPDFLKNQVFAAYGIASREPGEYEVDHVVPLEIGGSNSLKNLFAQSFRTQPWNAHVKDRLENKLHELVCSGKLDIRQAQREIASDWIASYQKYIGPPPGKNPAMAAAATGTEARQAAGMPSAGMNAASSLEAPPDASGGCPPEAPVKISGRGIYHTPSSQYYGRAKARRCFATPQAAEGAGYRAPKQ